MAATLQQKRKGPWSKQLGELSKYDWLTAVGLSSAHRLNPLDLRVAIALMNHADETHLAWMTQKTVKAFAGVADERQIRTAIASLRSSGAIETLYIGELDSASKAKIERSDRGKAYKLRMFWALEVFETTAKPAGQSEPRQLRVARQDRTTAVLPDGSSEAEPHRTTAVRCGDNVTQARDRTTTAPSDRTTAALHRQDYSAPPNTKLKPNDTDSARKPEAESSSISAYLRASRGE
jgi:hypothetical protein